MTKTNDLTEGKVSRMLLGFFFPMLFTNLLQQLYTFADTAIVGKGLGDNALAAVGNMSALTLLIIGFAQGITNGFSVIVAQHFGSRDMSALRKSIAASIKLSAILSVILTVISLIFLKNVLLIMQTDTAILKDSLIYGYIIFGGLTATMAYNLCSCILRALGDSKTPFLAIVVSSILNILLDCLFIFVLKTGVGGAAIATVLAQIISVVICVIRRRKTESIQLTRQDFKSNFSLSVELLKNGIPMACMNSVTAVGCMIVQSYVNALGVVYTSAYSACNRYVNLFMLPSVTAGFAVSAFTSQNYGAKKYDRIKSGVRVGLMIGLVSYLVLGMVMVLFPQALAKVLLNGQEPITLAAHFLQICGSMFFTLNFLFVYRSTVQGMGKPLVPMCSGLLEMGLRILVIVLCLSRIGFKATAYAEVIAWTGAFVLNFAAYLMEMRKYTARKQ
ncbi:MAG: MATE family efflux transporter [Ruminococcus sp.]|nr:MATE family efflux transporter [Ruminococcus sp.]